MSNIVAAIGLGQLFNLDQIVAGKRAIFDLYSHLLTDVFAVEWMPEADYGRCNRWLSVAMLEQSGIPESEITDNGEPSAVVMDLIKSLEIENIEARPIWKPMHMQPLFKDAKTYLDGTSEELFKNGLCLASSTTMIKKDIEKIVKAIKENLTC